MEPGHRIEHYVVIEKIGQGGQAAVWSAYDERLKRTVAVKTISMASIDSADKSGTAPAGGSLTTPDRFREEAQIIAALEHPNILPIYAFGQEGDALYIIMRYMAAGSLKDLLKHGRLDLDKALALIEPLANALDVAHQNQIIHRDIKSANILLDARHNPYLADFGLSMTIGDKNSLAGVGTLAYMSPEQMMGEPLDHRSDLYAFGVLIYEVLAGQLPKVNEQPWNLQQTMTQAPLPAPADMPPAVVEVLRRTTALDPADRYDSASEITAALRATLTPSGAPVEGALLITDPAMLALKEANDLFERAQERWSDGAGRFRLEAGDFKYIDSFYSTPGDWGIHLDDVARRLMLRAALEHGHNLTYWWSQLDDVADQRAVSLQTLTSDLAPARLRAIQQLSTIDDSEPPAIPIRVANVIWADPDAAVRLAGIALLEQRAFPLKEWRFAAFSEVIDATLAELAAQDPDPKVAEAAARACARLYSASAIKRLAYLASEGDRRALHALTYAREEIPAFPDGVPASIRRRVFTALSLRQLLADPLSLVGRYAGAALGYGLGLAVIIYVQFVDPNGLLAAQRIGNALAVGALYGVLTGFGILAATEPAARLRAWTRPGRIVLSWVLGALLTTAAFILFQRYFYFENAPDWQWILAIAGVFVSGFAISSGLIRRTWIRSVAGAVGALLAVYLVSWQIGFFNRGAIPVITLSEFQDDVSLVLSAWLALAVGVFTFLPEWLRAVRRMGKSA